MFAHKFRIFLKSRSLSKFAEIVDREIIPLLQKQAGFRDAIVFTVPDGGEAVGISLWEEKENVDSYSREIYPEVIRVLWEVLEGTPQAHKYEVASSTFHNMTVAVTG